MTVPPPPNPLPQVNILDLPQGTPVHRIHSSVYVGEQFNPCLGNPTRFAPIYDPAGVCVPTIYAADSLEAAVFETIFHDVPASARLKVVRLSNVLNRSYSRIEIVRGIKVAKLFAPDLSALGVTRQDLTEALPAHFADTAKWAVAFHAARTDIDGIVWTSNQCDPERAFLLYGDRVQSADLRVTSRRDAATDTPLVGEIRTFGARAAITLTT